jgi:hypothetical protein
MSIAWRVFHPNGQQVRCSVLRERGLWRVQEWLNDFVACGEYFDNRAAALRRATTIRRELERRGFRVDRKDERTPPLKPRLRLQRAAR